MIGAVCLGKWINWMMWGITYPFLGALLSAILLFLAIKNGDLWKPQLAFLGINSDAFAIVGAIGAAISFMITIFISVVFWVVAGVISIKTTPMLARTSLKGSVNFIFVPWLSLSLFILLLNLAIAPLMADPFTILAAVVVNFAISLVINYIFIWVSVWINTLLKMQIYLPA
jgi:hypothetical protein